jgi:hypothetical protein
MPRGRNILKVAPRAGRPERQGTQSTNRAVDEELGKDGVPAHHKVRYVSDVQAGQSS